MNTLEKLQAIIDHCKCSVSIDVRPNAHDGITVEKYFSNILGDDASDADKFDAAACIEAGTIFALQVYPFARSSFYVTRGPTLEYVVDRIYEGLRL